ncbi:hypothetical protein DPMN_062467 [Dreissena polymorpha]|uniref:Uncharacterized protein n=1 Tax=Dreissena polymorpha TaxID=45954 RepID=A0A9D4HK79_DREPO|nr:hypothetical protein DPMN_062467 [Dreissena polymorpha]
MFRPRRWPTTLPTGLPRSSPALSTSLTTVSSDLKSTNEPRHKICWTKCLITWSLLSEIILGCSSWIYHQTLIVC